MKLYKEGKNCIVMRHVLYLERHHNGAFVVQTGSTWNPELDTYNNAAWLTADEVPKFEEALEKYLESGEW